MLWVLVLSYKFQNLQFTVDFESNHSAVNVTFFLQFKDELFSLAILPFIPYFATICYSMRKTSRRTCVFFFLLPIFLSQINETSSKFVVIFKLSLLFVLKVVKYMLRLGATMPTNSRGYNNCYSY